MKIRDRLRGSYRAQSQVIAILSNVEASLPNMKSKWNDGMNYGFSAIKVMMWIIGVWPLQRKELASTIRFIVIFIAESLTLINMLIEPFKSCGDVKDTLEICLMMESGLHAWINTFFARFYMKKIAVNVNSAIEDWCSTSTEKEPYSIMTGYARIGRVITMSQLILGSLATFLYFTSIIVGNKQQVVTFENENITLWNFVLPATCLFKDVSYSTYKALYAMQILQGLIMFMAELASDSFFFSITMHLCGQLELLKIHFLKIRSKIHDEKDQTENPFGQWIERHCHLITLAKNIEEAFTINILIRLIITTIVIAISGMRILMSLKHEDYNDVIKSITFIMIFFLQSILFTHAGDTLYSQSESIISTVYGSTWHDLPSTRMKDLVLIMMRTKIPLRLSGGKFFYITRSTMTDILKTAMSYISFLRVTMEE